MKKRNLCLIAMTFMLIGCDITVSSNDNLSSYADSVESENSVINSTNSDENVISSEMESDISSDELISSSESSIVSSENKVSVDKAFTKYGTVAEGIYGEWLDSNASKATVSYKLVGTSKYISIDKELVRNLSSDNKTARFDILGIASGLYDVKVTTSSNSVIEMHNVSVASYDRSGYAHFNNSKGVGAYNNDGTPKSNADIIYVTDKTKNTVTYNGKTGIVNILNGVKSKTLIIRIIGRISTRSYDQDKKTYTRDDALGITDINNLSNKDDGDNSYWNMCFFSNSTGGLTIEGVGEDAEIFQWGMSIKNSKYVEVRNLTFTDYPEDACAIEGSSFDKSSDTQGTQYIWIHNNVFNAGKNYLDRTPEQDKGNGDGATDMKQCSNVTISYNNYNNCHKTGLVGGGDSQLSNKITFHHNYYNGCKSRLPLGRQANMHMYNNYYYKISGTAMSIRANAYVLSEYNYFESTSNPIVTQSNAVVKSFNNKFKYCSGTNNGTEVTDRTKNVSNSNSFNTKFDTDSSYFYYDSVNKVTDVTYLTSAEQAKIDCVKYAGICKNSPLSVSTSKDDNELNSSINSSENYSEYISSESKNSETSNVGDTILFNAADLQVESEISSNIKHGIFEITATSEKTISIKEDDSFKSFDSSYTQVVDLGGAGNESSRSIKFTLTKSAKVYIYAKSNNTSDERTIVIKGSSEYSFDPITKQTELKTSLDAGSYYVCSSSKGMSIAAIKIVY